VEGRVAAHFLLDVLIYPVCLNHVAIMELPKIVLAFYKCLW
jgi:hypothetical protein